MGEQKVEWFVTMQGSQLHAVIKTQSIIVGTPACCHVVGWLVPANADEKRELRRCKTCCRVLGIEPGVGVPE